MNNKTKLKIKETYNIIVAIIYMPILLTILSFKILKNKIRNHKIRNNSQYHKI